MWYLASSFINIFLLYVIIYYLHLHHISTFVCCVLQCTWYNHCYPDYFLFTFTKILLKMTMTWQFLGQHTGHHSNGLPCLSQVYLGQIYIWAKLYLYISGFTDCRKGEGGIAHHRFLLNWNFFHWL